MAPPRNKLSKIFTGTLYQFSTVRKTSMTDDVTDWPLPKKIFGCATAHSASISSDYAKVLESRISQILPTSEL